MSETHEHLRELVRKYSVCYEVYPEYAFINDVKVPTGFDVELHGIREQDAMRLTPGDKSSHMAFSDVREIAQFVVPTTLDASDYTISPFDCALHESPRRNFRPEVICALGITHQHGPAGKAACDEACLANIETKLKSLGASRAH